MSLFYMPVCKLQQNAYILGSSSGIDFEFGPKVPHKKSSSSGYMSQCIHFSNTKIFYKNKICHCKICREYKKRLESYYYLWPYQYSLLN